MLAVASTITLVFLLFDRTHSAEFNASISGPPAGRTADQPAYFPAPPGTLAVYVVTRGEPSDQELDGLARAGITSSGIGTSDGTVPMLTYWGFQIPAEAARSSRAGDELLIRARMLDLPGLKSGLKYVRYELRSGEEIRSFGAATNAKFMLTWTLVAAAPLLLWGAVAGFLAVSNLLQNTREVR